MNDEEISVLRLSVSRLNAALAYYRTLLPDVEDDEPYGEREIILNMLTDLMHYCKAKHISFTSQMDDARKCFADEQTQAAAKSKPQPVKEIAKK